MLRRISGHFDDMAVVVAIWMCVLPLVGLLVIPFFGLKVGLVVAATLFIAAMGICWGICGWKLYRN